MLFRCAAGEPDFPSYWPDTRFCKGYRPETHYTSRRLSKSESEPNDVNVVQMRRRRARFSIILAGYPILQGLSAGDPSDCPETHLTGRRPIRLAGDPLGGRKLLHRWPEMSQFFRVSAYMPAPEIVIVWFGLICRFLSTGFEQSNIH